MTNCILTNIEISFTKSKQTFKYAISIPIIDKTNLDIEMTDYGTWKNGVHEASHTLKSK